MSTGDGILIALALIAVVPIGVIAIETLMAILPRRSRPPANSPRPACVILVPAHNEEFGIAGTVASLKEQLGRADRIVVIADNCSDRTAEVARRLGVETIERHDGERRGKGYALAFGLSCLESAPPEMVVLVDADTRPCPGSLDALIAAASRWQAPVQGVFTDAPKQCGAREQWSAFALTFKNLVRPLGLHRLGLPCLLTGSGMAFPWPVIRKAELGTGNIVEDMQLGVDLAVAGHSPRFCPEARFESDDAPNVAATAARRTRWEHGHVFTALSQGPRLLLQSIGQLRPALAALALELSVPPLSLLFMIQAGLLAVCLINWQLLEGSYLPALILSSGLVAGTLTILTVWLIFGRRLISLKILCLLPIYILWKVPIYLKLLLAPQQKWVRTERNSVG